MKKRSIICLLVIFAMLFISCAKNNDHDDKDVTSTDTTSATMADTSLIVEDTEAPETELVPDLELRNFDGRTFNILCDKWSTYDPLDYTDIAPKLLNGEALNDAAYNRNVTMENKYNCKVSMEMMNNGLGISTVAKGVKAGSLDYDVFLMRGSNLANAVTSGYLVNFADIENVDTDMPWWDAASLQAMKVGGKTYAAIGYTTTNFMKSVFTMVFNKQVITDYGLEDPYKLAENGKWTFDKVIEMSKATAHDMNNDGTMGSGDFFGINYTRDCFSGMLHACGVTYAEVLDSGDVRLTFNNEINTERISHICDVLFDSSHAADTLSGTVIKTTSGTDLQFFAEGLATFAFTATHSLDTIRQMTVNFGMVQYPKYSENDEYKSPVAGPFLSMTTVPVTVKDTTDIGYFLETYAYEGYKTVRPAFYDILIQGKMVPDDNASVILDNIYNNIYYDTGALYNFNTMVTLMNALAKEQNKAVASYFKTISKALEKSIDTFNKAVNK